MPFSFATFGIILCGSVKLSSGDLPAVERKLTKREQASVSVERWARHFGLNPEIVRAQKMVETSGNPSCIEVDHDTGEKISFGILQVHPGVGERAWVAYGGVGPYYPGRCLDPDFGAFAGCRHLKWLLDRSGGSYLVALSKYNLGEDGYEKYYSKLSDRKINGKKVRFFRRYIERIEKELGRPL